MDSRQLHSIASRISSGTVRTAGKIEFVKDTGPIRRDLRVEGFEWSTDALRNLTKILWAAQRSHSYAVAALRLFSKMPSSQFSPDGLLGGRGYIQSIKELRSGLSSTVEALSSFTDTIYDEVNGDHWGSVTTKADEKIIKDAERVKEDPEGYVEGEFKEESSMSSPMTPHDMNPSPEDFGEPSHDENSDEFDSDETGFAKTSGTIQDTSRFSGWNDSDIMKSVSQEEEEEEAEAPSLPFDSSYQSQGMTPPEMMMKTTSSDKSGFHESFNKMIKSHRTAGGPSSLPVDTMPGPRVDKIGPGTTEFGWFNGPDAVPSDDPSMGGIYQYDHLLEDDSRDGVTGYDNPTDGDASVLVVSSGGIQHYSWLPGSRNEKNLGYYDRGLSESDIQWMRDHSDPDNPIRHDFDSRPDSSWIWESI